MSQKKVNVANFNVVFLEEKDEAPLLKYFDSIVVPAFQSGIKKDNKDAELFFMMLSRLVDTFFSRTSWTMLLYAENHSISVA